MTATEFNEMFDTTKLSELSDEDLCALQNALDVAVAKVKNAIIKRKYLRTHYASKEKK